MTWRRKLTTLFVFILSFVLIGGLELVTATSSVEVLKSSRFWIGLVGTTFANFIVLYSMAIHEINKGSTTDKEVLDKDEKLKTTINNHVDDTIDEFLKIENLKRKKIAWKNKIHRKISKSERFARRKSIEIFTSGSEEDKKNNRYCRKRLKYLEMLDEEYIEKNISYLRVKYPKLRRYEIITGVKQRSDYYSITTNTSGRVIRDNYSKFLFSFGMIVFFNSLMLEPGVITVAIVVRIVGKILTLTMNAFNGREYGRWYVPSVIVSDLQFRLDTIISYMKWKVNNKGVENKDTGAKIVTLPNNESNVVIAPL